MDLITVNAPITLNELEKIIEKGLETFVEVGQALREIKDRRLWADEYESFDTYCQKRWHFGQANAYYLIGAAQVATNVGAETLTASHVAPLKPLTPENQNRAWQEIQAIPIDQRTGKVTKAVATKYKIIEKLGADNPITKAMLAGQITPNQAGQVALELRNAPDKYLLAIQKWGCPQAGVVTALKNMQHEWAVELDEILISGVLDDGKKAVKFATLAVWHVEKYTGKLISEKIKQRQLEAAIVQAETVRDVILDGPDTLNPPASARLAYLFPEGANAQTIVDMLDRNGYDIFMVVAYKGNPNINFNQHQQVPIKQINGVKPDPVVKMMQQL